MNTENYMKHTKDISRFSFESIFKKKTNFSSTQGSRLYFSNNFFLTFHH